VAASNTTARYRLHIPGRNPNHPNTAPRSQLPAVLSSG